jgi:CheY-like chemotaxis protein
MNKIKGKLILIDDELYEKELLKQALNVLGWDIELEHFNNAEDALEFLKQDKKEIFIIIADMNMPKMSGLDLKKTIDKNKELRTKAIPFIFASNSASKEEVIEAYDYGIQGYFKKPNDLNATIDMLDTIIKYWIISRHPNNVK